MLQTVLMARTRVTLFRIFNLLLERVVSGLFVLPPLGLRSHGPGNLGEGNAGAAQGPLPVREIPAPGRACAEAGEPEAA